MDWQRFLRSLRVSCFGLMASVSASGQAADTPQTEIEIRWTADGVPHIRAENWQDLGYGYGYVQGRDALCTLAEAFVTFEGRRSYFFGPEARPSADSTFGRPRNIELDVFFRAFADAEVIEQYRRQQPAGLIELIDGFAEGYNRHLWDVRRSKAGSTTRHACLHEPWVRPITADDIYRRMTAVNLAAGYAKFIPEIVNAAPAKTANTAKGDESAGTLRRRLAATIGEEPALGSNALAFGRAATGADSAVLVGNPHWFWRGPDRFYQAHLTIPGRLNVAGVSFLGIPVIMIGFNEHIAWSHTVSAARRFGLFELALGEAGPTVYLHEGRDEPMQAEQVTVDVRGADGKVTALTRTLYRTRFGPIVDLGAHADSFGWSAERALAIRDINADNFRIFRTFFYWNQAGSLREFVDIQRREAGMPWANTVAIGHNDGRVWYGDIGAVPNVPDALREVCTTALGQEFAQVDAIVPFLDGSRAACDWQADEHAVQPGSMPAQNQPALWRDDYVANMNDSYWLSSPRRPLEGYAQILGGEREPLSLRSRLGHRIAGEQLANAPLPARELSRRLRHAVLDPRVHSAELFKLPVLDRVCPLRLATVDHDILTDRTFTPARRVDLSSACTLLRQWNNKGDVRERGAHLWDAFWARAERIPPGELFRAPFTPARPLDAPGDLNVDDRRIVEAFGAAMLAISDTGLVLDAPRGSYFHVGAGRDRVPLYGGCEDAGYFVVTCGEEGGSGIAGNIVGNSYLQVVSFDAAGVEAYTLLAHGQDDTDTAALRRYAAKRWLRFAFTEEQIRRESGARRIVLKP